MFDVGHVFTWGNNNRAVIVKVLNEEFQRYYCVYHQNGIKHVVSSFEFINDKWHLLPESGRVIKTGEFSSYLRKL